MSIYKSCRLGTQEVAYEEADDPSSACEMAGGWELHDCEVVDVTNIIINLGGGSECQTATISKRLTR